MGKMTLSQMVAQLAGGMGTSIQIFVVTLVFSLPLGLIVAFGRMTKNGFLRNLVKVYISIMRGTPLMLQLILIFYGPGIWLGHNIWGSQRMLACTVAFVLNYACYFSVIYRGGIEGVPVGQQEAGQVLGMTRGQIFRHVTLLQMVKRIVPPMSNEIITLVKDTSIARIISLQEVIWAGYAFLKSSHGYKGLLWPLFFTGVYYLIFNGALTLLFGWVEKKLSYFQ